MSPRDGDEEGSLGRRSLSRSRYLLLVRQAGNMKNQLSTQWPAYMTCKYSEYNKANHLRNVPENGGPGKTLDVNRKLGMSEDFPLSSGAHQKFFKGSRSIFSTEPRSQAEPGRNTSQQQSSTTRPKSHEKGGAGLGTDNSMHNVLYFNGKKEKP